VKISYLQNAASSQEQNWRVQCEKARIYLHKKLNNPDLEQQLLKTCNKYVVQKSTTIVVRKQKLKEKRIALTIAQAKTTEETVKKVISIQKSDGSFELSEDVSKHLDVSSTDTLVNTCRAFATDKRIKSQIKDNSIWTTAITRKNIYTIYCCLI